MKYASVCDGIGAAHVAWQHLGWECAWTSEIEPFPCAVVEQRLGLKNLGDMTKITEEMLDEQGPVDLLVGGTPCQSFSVAGLRGGLADPRGNLALRFVQLAAVMQPKWIVWENVPGVLSSGGGRDFGTFLGALAELGYGFAYRVLDAQWFGVAQRRRRVFVVGYLGDWRRAAAVLFERESVFGNPPTRRKTWEGVARSTAASLTSSGRGVERPGESRGQDDVVLAFGGNKSTGSTDVAASLLAGKSSHGRLDFGTETFIAFHPTQDPISSVDGSTHAMGCGSKGGCSTQAVAFAIDGGNQSASEEIHHSLRTGRDSGDAVAFSAKDCGADAAIDCSPTMRAMGHSGSHANGGGQLAVAWKPSHYTRGKDGSPSDVYPPLVADAGRGDQEAVVAIQERAICENPDAGPDGAGVRCDGAAYTLEARTVPQAVAFQQNTRDEVRKIGGDGDICGALAAEDGMKQQNYVAIPAVAFKPGQSEAAGGVFVSEEFAPTLQSQNNGSTAVPAVAFKESQSGCRLGTVRATLDANKGSRRMEGVMEAMAVRRLTPCECERLQGFPDDYTLVEYRKKPAADGPRYKALGNSMAVPVMAWIGNRIALVEAIQ
jgi:DNA (cytosine-5)-methyltransferase 1